MSGQRTVLVWISCLVALLLAGLFAKSWTGTRDHDNGAAERAVLDAGFDHEAIQLSGEEEKREAAIHGGRFHKPLRTYVDHPGVDQPELTAIDDANLVDETPVIGIEVDGRFIALVMEKMMDPLAHIVNMNFGGEKSVSVSYCYLADCVRVVSKESKTPIPLHVGGMDVDNQMVYLLDGERYGQMSPVLPLADYPFERTTLGDWRKLHPHSQICVPPSRASIEHRIPGKKSHTNG